MNIAYQSAPRLASGWVKQIWFDMLDCITPSRVRKVVFGVSVIVFAIGVMRVFSSPSALNIAMVLFSGPIAVWMFHSARVEQQRVNFIAKVAQYLKISSGEAVVWDRSALNKRASQVLFDKAVEAYQEWDKLSLGKKRNRPWFKQSPDQDDPRDIAETFVINKNEFNRMAEAFQAYGIIQESEVARILDLVECKMFPL